MEKNSYSLDLCYQTDRKIKKHRGDIVVKDHKKQIYLITDMSVPKGKKNIN